MWLGKKVDCGFTIGEHWQLQSMLHLGYIMLHQERNIWAVRRLRLAMSRMLVTPYIL